LSGSQKDREEVKLGHGKARWPGHTSNGTGKCKYSLQPSHISLRISRCDECPSIDERCAGDALVDPHVGSASVMIRRGHQRALSGEDVRWFKLVKTSQPSSSMAHWEVSRADVAPRQESSRIEPTDRRGRCHRHRYMQQICVLFQPVRISVKASPCSSPLYHHARFLPGDMWSLVTLMLQVDACHG